MRVLHRAVLDDLPHYRSLAQQGRALVSRMFDVRRTAGELHEIYPQLVGGYRTVARNGMRAGYGWKTPAADMMPAAATSGVRAGRTA